MTIIIDKSFPVLETLLKERISIVSNKTTSSNSLNPTSLLIVNLMPTKIETEKQFLRILESIPLNIKVEFLYPQSHKPKNISQEYLETYYKTLENIQKKSYDGMIITGAPLEHLEFEDVFYWEELKKIMDFAKENVKSTIYICWAAQASLYYHYNIPKHPLTRKIFGVFSHTITNKNARLFQGFDDQFLVPHSRHAEIKREDIEKVPLLEVLSESKESGIYIVASKDRRQFFVMGHSEYDSLTLKKEYERDVNKGVDIQIPKNYFAKDDPSQEPIVKWRAHSNLLFTNWISQYILK